MNKTILIVAFLSLMCIALARGEDDDDGFLKAIQPRAWSFPRDHGRHDGYKIEWWYFTGNLADDAGRKFGYQVTFFRSAIAPSVMGRLSPWAALNVYFAHAAVSDVANQQFVFADHFTRQHPRLAMASDKTMDVTLLNWSAKLDGSTIALRANEPDFDITLDCTGGRGPFSEGPGGVNAKGREPGQASYYYSMTRLATHGTLHVGGKNFHVSGNSWMDHEFSSNALSPTQVGWDWFGLQLTDGTDLMIYRMRAQGGGTDYLSGTRVGADGVPHYLSADEITIAGSKPWKSSQTGAEYPQTWALSIKGVGPIVVQSEMPGQELITGGDHPIDYFEGAADVLDHAGKNIGEGYLEMTGYDQSLTTSNQ